MPDGSVESPPSPRRLTLPARNTDRDVESARHDGRTAQASLLLMVPIASGHLADLEQLLRAIAVPPGGEDLELNPIIPFRLLETVHFARLLIHHASPSAEAPIPEWKGEPQASGPPIPAKLLFATDYDGPLDHHIDELLRVAGEGLDRVFAHCDGWPGHRRRDAAHAFFEEHRVYSNTFYTGTMHRSVAQIRREMELRAHIEDYLDAYGGSPEFPADPVQARQRIREFVFSQPSLAWAKEQPGPFPKPLLPPSVTANLKRTAGIALGLLAAAAIAFLRPRIGLGSAAGLVFGVVELFVIVGFSTKWYLSYLAARDPVIIREDVQEITARLVRTEDRIVQNEMSSVIYIKRPLWFRRLVLRAVLAFINLSAKYISNEGTLAGIPSIHFARWVIVDEGRRLVFFSNFDGTWENYLGDFIDKAHAGLTAVWSNCVGFPRTEGLTGKGATDEQRFKAYSRQTQIPTHVWYSAYRWLSVSNINDNTRLRLGLYGDMNAAQTQAWLRGAVARRPTALPKPPAASAAVTVDVPDVQGLVARSYRGLKEAAYLPIVFAPDNPAAARSWLAEVIGLGLVTPASRASADIEAEGRALNLAFTYDGLRALGIEARGAADFSREFKEGMAGEHRQRLLGDTGTADPRAWKWGGPAHPIGAMLFLFADTPARLAAMCADEIARAERFAATAGPALDSLLLRGDKEHFGFHDGIAQPRIAGLNSDRGAVRIAGLNSDRGAVAKAATIPAGEVVLGYANAYGILPMSPVVRDDAVSRSLLPEIAADPLTTGVARRDLGRNGTYVVFRQLHQDVAAFWSFVDRRAQSDPQRRKRLAAKMVGRWPNGAPLVQYPDAEPATFDEDTANAFWYRRDLAGDRCPVGSHIRRSNPRDGLMPGRADSLLVSDRHRLLRRGRPYGPPLAESFEPADILRAAEGAPIERGLHFICFNTDIGRQFEFVQSTWVNNLKFDGLYADPDPIVAPHVDPAEARHDEQISRFTIQGCPVRERVSDLPRVVTMVGGAYLFMPGLKALRYLASEPA